jgi:hypothetical protein
MGGLLYYTEIFGSQKERRRNTQWLFYQTTNQINIKTHENAKRCNE